jgi:Tol biopolymer transport system component
LTDSDVEILPAGQFQRFNSLTVTPDGNYVDAVAVSGGNNIPDLWRMPLLGGTPKLVLAKVQSAPGWSPDGRHFAFIRSENPREAALLIVADPDGSNERVLVTRKPPLAFWSDNVGSYFPLNRPAWSADGQTLVVVGASSAQDRRNKECELDFFDAASGRETRTDILSAECMREVAWRDPSHLVASGGSTWRPALRLWDLVSKTSSPLIQDFPIIANLSVTADGRMAVASRVERRTGIWTSEKNGERLVVRVPGSAAGAEQPFIDNQGALTYIAATRDGFFSLYHLAPGSANPVVIANKVMYLEDPEAGVPPPPAVAMDGRTVLFTQTDAPWALFKVSTDGSNLTKVVDENAAGPAIVADGQHVLFTKVEGPGLYVAPLAGGEPRRLYDGPVVAPITVSPDGRRALFRIGRPGEVMTCELPDCGDRKLLRLPSVMWAPDGQGVVSIDSNDARRVVETPVNGGSVRELIRLADGGDPISSLAWSPDGKLLALSRGRWTTDIVLITGLR